MEESRYSLKSMFSCLKSNSSITLLSCLCDIVFHAMKVVVVNCQGPWSALVMFLEVARSFTWALTRACRFFEEWGAFLLCIGMQARMCTWWMFVFPKLHNIKLSNPFLGARLSQIFTKKW